jgi:hypothetical protein
VTRTPGSFVEPRPSAPHLAASRAPGHNALGEVSSAGGKSRVDQSAVGAARRKCAARPSSIGRATSAPGASFRAKARVAMRSAHRKYSARNSAQRGDRNQVADGFSFATSLSSMKRQLRKAKSHSGSGVDQHVVILDPRYGPYSPWSLKCVRRFQTVSATRLGRAAASATTPRPAAVLLVRADGRSRFAGVHHGRKYPGQRFLVPKRPSR